MMITHKQCDICEVVYVADQNTDDDFPVATLKDVADQIHHVCGACLDHLQKRSPHTEVLAMVRKSEERRKTRKGSDEK